ncbi:hypothetical protein ACLMJK_000363 [Lecanora helva]
METQLVLDENVIAKLPQGHKVLSAQEYGSSKWTTITACITVATPDGRTKQYFMKCAEGDNGRLMMEGEYASMTELYNTMPSFVPKPLAWGKYHIETPPTYFFLCNFIEISDRLPDPGLLCTNLVELHQKSASPTGKFGFHVPTCQGKTPQRTEWESSWTVFFTKLLSDAMGRDFDVNGTWKELEPIAERTLSHIIPRLLGPLEADGRRVKPSLIHADLWEGNIASIEGSDEILVFDAGCLYAHHEMEIANWRCPYNKIYDKIYSDTYWKLCEKSEPIEDWEDRSRLYNIYYNILYSVNAGRNGKTVAGKSIRQLAYDAMAYLVDKYAPSPVGSKDASEKDARSRELDLDAYFPTGDDNQINW